MAASRPSGVSTRGGRKAVQRAASARPQDTRQRPFRRLDRISDKWK
jgi:hypothetical protein